jgi:hypothetical protein
MEHLHKEMGPPDVNPPSVALVPGNDRKPAVPIAHYILPFFQKTAGLPNAVGLDGRRIVYRRAGRPGREILPSAAAKCSLFRIYPL